MILFLSICIHLFIGSARSNCYKTLDGDAEDTSAGQVGNTDTATGT